MMHSISGSRRRKVAVCQSVATVTRDYVAADIKRRLRCKAAGL